MSLRLATLADLDEAFQIIEEARYRLKQAGSLQWNTGDGYPSYETLKNDILNHQLYVYETTSLLGLAALIPGLDKNYVHIDGKWQTSGDNYLTIHRIAIANKALNQSIGFKIIEGAKEVAKNMNLTSIKADTHKVNKPMLKLLDKSGFIHCGEITLLDSDIDNKREAFEYVL